MKESFLITFQFYFYNLKTHYILYFIINEQVKSIIQKFKVGNFRTILRINGGIFSDDGTSMIFVSETLGREKDIVLNLREKNQFFFEKGIYIQRIAKINRYFL